MESYATYDVKTGVGAKRATKRLGDVEDGEILIGAEGKHYIGAQFGECVAFVVERPGYPALEDAEHLDDVCEIAPPGYTIALTVK